MSNLKFEPGNWVPPEKVSTHHAEEAEESERCYGCATINVTPVGDLYQKDGVWYERIAIYGKSQGDAEVLRDRIIAGLQLLHDMYCNNECDLNRRQKNEHASYT